MTLRDFAKKFHGTMVVKTPEGETYYQPIPEKILERFVHDFSVSSDTLQVMLFPSFHHESTTRISVPLKDGKSRLFAEIGGDPDHPEVFTYVTDEEGAAQDLTAAEEKDDIISVSVWTDCASEEYTHQFQVQKYKEEGKEE